MVQIVFKLNYFQQENINKMQIEVKIKSRKIVILFMHI